MATITTDVEPYEENVPEPQLGDVIAPLHERAVAVALAIDELEIVGPDTDYQMADLQAQAAAMRRDLADDRDARTKPYNRVKQLIIDTFKPVQATVEAAEKTAKAKRFRWDQHVKEEERKENARQQKLADARNARAEKKAEERGEEPPAPIIPMATVPPKPKTLHTAAGRVTLSYYWTWEPQESEAAMVEALAKAGEYGLLTLDRGAVKKRVESGVRTLPGARIYEAAR